MVVAWDLLQRKWESGIKPVEELSSKIGASLQWDPVAKAADGLHGDGELKWFQHKRQEQEVMLDEVTVGGVRPMEKGANLCRRNGSSVGSKLEAENTKGAPGEISSSGFALLVLASCYWLQHREKKTERGRGEPLREASVDLRGGRRVALALFSVSGEGRACDFWENKKLRSNL